MVRKALSRLLLAAGAYALVRWLSRAEGDALASYGRQMQAQALRDHRHVRPAIDIRPERPGQPVVELLDGVWYREGEAVGVDDGAGGIAGPVPLDWS